GGHFCDYTLYAENLWNANSYPNGFTGGLHKPCGDTSSGWINLCIQTRGFIQGLPGCNYQFVVGCTLYNKTTWEPTEHLNYTWVSICWDCGLSDTGLRNTVAHEYGHSIGLGHSNVNGDLMCGAPENGTCGISNTGLNGVNAADRDANSKM